MPMAAACCNFLSWAGDEFGLWTINPKRSTDPSPKTLSTLPKELFLDITEQQLDGRRFYRRLVLVKLSGAGTTATQVVGKREKAR